MTSALAVRYHSAAFLDQSIQGNWGFMLWTSTPGLSIGSIDTLVWVHPSPNTHILKSWSLEVALLGSVRTFRSSGLVEGSYFVGDTPLKRSWDLAPSIFSLLSGWQEVRSFLQHTLPLWFMAKWQDQAARDWVLKAKGTFLLLNVLISGILP